MARPAARRRRRLAAAFRPPGLGRRVVARPAARGAGTARACHRRLDRAERSPRLLGLGRHRRARRRARLREARHLRRGCAAGPAGGRGPGTRRLAVVDRGEAGGRAPPRGVHAGRARRRVRGPRPRPRAVARDAGRCVGRRLELERLAGPSRHSPEPQRRQLPAAGPVLRRRAARLPLVRRLPRRHRRECRRPVRDPGHGRRLGGGGRRAGALRPRPGAAARRRDRSAAGGAAGGRARRLRRRPRLDAAGERPCGRRQRGGARHAQQLRQLLVRQRRRGRAGPTSASHR